MIGGVCGGLGAYLGIDSMLIRLFFVLLTLGHGAGIMIYLLLWILLPCSEQGDLASTAIVRSGAEEVTDRARTIGADLRTAVRTSHPQAGLIAGAGLVVLGVMFLMQNLHIVWLSWLDFDVLWPALLIAGGMALIWRRTKGVSS
jgi:phage shock protein C